MQLSIIIPIYNAEKYLAECLNSLKNIQNIDFECLMIDDGSIDNSKIICEKYIDDRFRYFYKKNTGVSSTRNYGIEESKGKYILFLDADDYLNNNIENSIINAMKRDADFTVFDYKIKLNEKLINKKFIQEKKDILEDAIYKIYSTSELNTCWGKLFKKKIIEKNGLRFYEDIRIGEDQIFVMEYINSIKSVQYVHEEIITYRINRMSAMNTYDPYERLADFKNCYSKMKNTKIVRNSEKIFYQMNYSCFKSLTHYFKQFAYSIDIWNYLNIYNYQIRDNTIKEIIYTLGNNCGINLIKRIELILIKKKFFIGGIYFFLKGKIMKIYEEKYN